MNDQPRTLSTRLMSALLIATLAALIVIGCSSPPPTATPLPPTSTLVPPTATPLPPTATAVPPTATPLPPTPTPLPPTATPIPPTPTAVPPTATPAPDYGAYADVPGIVDPSNFGWPREVESSEGIISLSQPPVIAHFASQGHAEIAMGLIDSSRFAAVYSFFADPEGSNIADAVGDIPMIGFEPEEVVALEPEVIVVSKFTNPDLVAVFKDAGIPVLRTALEGSNGDVPNILLMAYILGAEERGLELAGEVEARLEFVRDEVAKVGIPVSERTSVLTVSELGDIWAAGAGSNVDNIIKDAGGVNAAAEIDNFQQISMESIAAMDPDMIIITQPMESGLVFADKLKTSPVLQDVGAIQNDNVHVVKTRHFTTLSHWNVRGVETLAKMLYPDQFADVEFEEFNHFDEK